MKQATIRFYQGEDDDLIEWYNSLPKTANFNALAKAALRDHIAKPGDNGQLSLGDIRAVVEAALSKYALAPGQPREAEETTDQVDEILDRFSQNVS